MMVPKRISQTLINALKSGVVPRVGLEYIAVGRNREIDALLHDIDIIEDGGATFRFVVGKYGSGKSFLLQTIRNYAMEKGFVVLDADLSYERRLTGTNGQGLATYRELVKNMATKTKPEGGALPLVLERWILAIRDQIMQEEQISFDNPILTQKVETKILKTIDELSDMVNGFDFAKVIRLYWRASVENNDSLKSMVLKWLRGEYSLKLEARRELGVSVIISDADWYEYLKLFSAFLVKAGYKGMLILIDELVNIYKVPHSVTRQYNYEKILTMYNDTLQGKANYIGIIMGATPQSIEDSRKGVFSYEALKTRLEDGKFVSENMKDMFAPIIKLAPLSNEDLLVLLEKLLDIHSNLYGYTHHITIEELVAFLKAEYGRIGASTNITPREIIKDFIQLLNLVSQNTGIGILQLLGSESFVYAQDKMNDDIIHEEFAEFSL